MRSGNTYNSSWWIAFLLAALSWGEQPDALQGMGGDLTFTQFPAGDDAAAQAVIICPPPRR